MKQFRIVILVLAVILAFACTSSAYYSPQAGRFLQRDPIGYVDGMNLYEYVRSTPCMSIDPEGVYASFCKFLPPNQWSDAERSEAERN
jgi:uncharacterized protein RhaS with RHS repeats